MEHLGIRRIGGPEMLLKTCAGSLQYVFSRVGKPIRQCCNVCRGGTCAKPDRVALLLGKPLTRKSRLAITGGRDKNDVSALSLVEKGHQPRALDQPMTPSLF